MVTAVSRESLDLRNIEIFNYMFILIICFLSVFKYTLLVSNAVNALFLFFGLLFVLGINSLSLVVLRKEMRRQLPAYKQIKFHLFSLLINFIMFSLIILPIPLNSLIISLYGTSILLGYISYYYLKMYGPDNTQIYSIIGPILGASSIILKITFTSNNWILEYYSVLSLLVGIPLTYVGAFHKIGV